MNNLIATGKELTAKKRMLILSLFFIFVIVSVTVMIFSTNKSKSANAFAPCTKTLSDKPESLADWKVSLYSAALESPTPSSSKANNVKSFSLKGLADKSEKNSFYARFELKSSAPITGYDTAIEVCNSENKTNALNQLAKYDSSSIIGEGISASEHFFHGGRYVLAPGVHRVDAFIKDKQGKWHLVGRVEDITITE
jgi:hypothetical protein